MYIFNSDLDNTLIFSYKHDIGVDKVNIERYEGREIGFSTQKTFNKLKDIVQKVMFVPTTTRTENQYKRIDLGIPMPKYALVCNGGILLKQGEPDESWYRESLDLVVPAEKEIELARKILEKDSRREFELRYINELFLYTKCSEPETVVSELGALLDPEKVIVLNNGHKLYVLPKNLSKGKAALRLKEHLGGSKIIAAGDSKFDISMLEIADFAIAPAKLKDEIKALNHIKIAPEAGIFSDVVLDFVESVLY